MADLAAAPAFDQRPLLGNWRSIIIAFYGCLLVALAFILSNPEQFFHWFIVPVTLCGALIGADAVQWLRGRLDTFDPVGLLGLFGLHFFFLAPLLIVAWDYQLLYLPPLDDWRPWLGQMAFLNLAGLALYRLSRRWVKPPAPDRPRRVWRLDGELFFIVLLFALAITFALQLAVYQQFGGLAGYINAYEESFTGTTSFAGFGALFTISESFPNLLMLGYVVWARRKGGGWRAWGVILLMLLLFFVLRIFFGGLRGSRSNTLFAMFWALAAVHVWLRPVPRNLVYAGTVVVFIFMYVFGFYKAVGSDFVQIFTNPSLAVQFETESGRSAESLLLGDLSRTDIQAFLLSRLLDPYSDYEYAYGRTYVSGIAMPIPRALWPGKPFHTRVEYATYAQYGQGTYAYNEFQSSRVYGLAGEAMLNFSPLVMPLAFIPFGLAVGWIRTRAAAWPPGDARRLLLPLLILLSFLLLTSDSDLMAIFLVRSGLIMFLVIRLCSSSKIIGQE